VLFAVKTISPQRAQYLSRQSGSFLVVKNLCVSLCFFSVLLCEMWLVVSGQWLVVNEGMKKCF
jgi:hypothetical protein